MARRPLFRPVRVFVAVLAMALLAGTFVGSTACGGTLSPLSGFGVNGWLAPGSISYLGTSSTERGFGWNPVTNNLVLPSRLGGGNSVAIIDGMSGSVANTLNTTGVSGGTIFMAGAGVSTDGEIYVNNVASGSAEFKVYKWAGENDTNAPSIAFSQVNPQASTGGFRFGDAFAVYGGGASLKFAAAGSSSGTTSGLANNGNFMLGSLDGSNTNTIYNAIQNTQTTSNDYRLSLAFVDADTIIGNQGTSAKFTDFVPATSLSGSGATVTGSVAVGSADKPLGYTVLNGQALMAVVNTTSSIISIYDVTNPAAASLLTTGSTVSGPLSLNANGLGAVQWGEVLSPTSQVLYAMSTNQGIQAMVFTAVPEPSTYAMASAGLACGGWLMLRRRRAR